MPQTRWQWIVLTVVIVIVGGAWIDMTRVDPTAQLAPGRPDAAQLGQIAPDFTLQALDGDSVTLSDYRGTPVVLNFWATWCSICKAEIPGMVAAYEDLEGDTVIIGVNVNEGAGLVAPYVDQMGISYPVWLDPDAAMAGAYDVRAFPTTYFIDERGVIVDMHIGSLGEAALRRQMRELGGGS